MWETVPMVYRSFSSGAFTADLPLGHQEDVLIGLHGPLQGRDGDRPLHVKGQCHVWKHRQAPEGQNGQIPSGQFHVLVPF